MLSPIRMEFTTIVIGTSTGCIISLGEIYFQFFFYHYYLIIFLQIMMERQFLTERSH